MKRNYHKEAIKILGDMVWCTETCRRIIYNIAQNNPAALVHALVAPIEYPEVERLIRKRDSKIHAIKELRNLSGMSVKDAKDWVENRERELGIK